MLHCKIAVGAVVSPQSQQPPDPGNAITFGGLFCIRKGVSLYDSASIAAKIRYFNVLLDLKKSVLGLATAH
jgi:hypothetical protein